MSNIHFNTIELNNFMSYEHVLFNLDRNGYILVSGSNNNVLDNAKSNGSGKSSLFSALCWCLTGETPNGNKTVENIYLEGTTSVELNFLINGNEIIIKRTKNPSNLFIYINGENKSGKGIRDTEKLLKEYLPDINSQVINSVIILGQGLPQRFTNNTPAGRKEVLEQLSNSDFMISDLKERLDTREGILLNRKSENSNKLIEIDTTIELKKETIRQNNKKLKTIDPAKLELDLEQLRLQNNKLKDDIDSYTSAIDEVHYMLNSAITSLQTLEEDKDKELNNITGLIPESTLEKLSNEIIELKSELRYKNSEITKLDSVVDICPTCGQKLPNIIKLDSSELKVEANILQDKLNDKTIELNSYKTTNKILVEEINTRYSLKIKDINLSISTYRNDIDNYESILEQKNIEFKNVNSEIIRIETDLNNVKDTIAQLTKEIHDIETDFLILVKDKSDVLGVLDDINKRLDIISKMKVLIRRDFRGYLLINIINYISDRAKKYSLKVFGSDKLLFALDGNNISISYDGKEYESLSGGEKQKLDVIIQLAIRDMLCNYLNFSSNILVLDEITDSLDIIGSQNILNLISSELNDVESIYIISHHTDFEIPYDEEITIIKGNDKISRIL